MELGSNFRSHPTSRGASDLIKYKDTSGHPSLASAPHPLDAALKKDGNASRPCAIISPDDSRRAKEALPGPAPAPAWAQPRAKGAACYLQQAQPPHYAPYPPRNISPRRTFQENMNRIIVPPPNTTKLRNAILPPENQSPDIAKKVISDDVKFWEGPVIINSNLGEGYRPQYGRPEDAAADKYEQQGSKYPVHHGYLATAAHEVYPGYNAYQNVYDVPPELQRYPLDYQTHSVQRGRPHPAYRKIPERTSYIVPEEYSSGGSYPRGNIRHEPYPPVKGGHVYARYDYQHRYPAGQYPPGYAPAQKTDDSRKLNGIHPDTRFYQFPQKYGHSVMPAAEFHAKAPAGARAPPGDAYPGSEGAAHPADLYAAHGKYSYDAYDKNVRAHPEAKYKLNYYNPYLNMPYPDAYYTNRHPENFHSSKFNAAGANYAMKPPLDIYSSYVLNGANFQKPLEMQQTERIMDADVYGYSRNYTQRHYNPLDRIPTDFSPNIISPVDSNTSGESLTAGAPLSHEDGGYVSQCSTASGHSGDVHSAYAPTPYEVACNPHRHVDGYPQFRPMNMRDGNNAPFIAQCSKPQNKSQNSKSSLDLRKYLQTWDEEYEDGKLVKGCAEKITFKDPEECSAVPNASASEQLYVLDKKTISENELHKYDHIQKVTKLPDNIKEYEFSGYAKKEESIKKVPNGQSKPFFENNAYPASRAMFRYAQGNVPQVQNVGNEFIDVEEKITQSVISKEKGRSNFEIILKPGSPGKNAPTQIQIAAVTDIQYSESDNRGPFSSSPVIQSNYCGPSIKSAQNMENLKKNQKNNWLKNTTNGYSDQPVKQRCPQNDEAPGKPRYHNPGPQTVMAEASPVKQRYLHNSKLQTVRSDESTVKQRYPYNSDSQSVRAEESVIHRVMKTTSLQDCSNAERKNDYKNISDINLCNRLNTLSLPATVQTADALKKSHTNINVRDNISLPQFESSDYPEIYIKVNEANVAVTNSNAVENDVSDGHSEKINNTFNVCVRNDFTITQKEDLGNKMCLDIPLNEHMTVSNNHVNLMKQEKQLEVLNVQRSNDLTNLILKDSIKSPSCSVKDKYRATESTVGEKDGMQNSIFVSTHNSPGYEILNAGVWNNNNSTFSENDLNSMSEEAISKCTTVHEKHEIVDEKKSSDQYFVEQDSKLNSCDTRQFTNDNVPPTVVEKSEKGGVIDYHFIKNKGLNYQKPISEFDEKMESRIVSPRRSTEIKVVPEPFPNPSPQNKGASHHLEEGPQSYPCIVINEKNRKSNNNALEIMDDDNILASKQPSNELITRSADHDEYDLQTVQLHIPSNINEIATKIKEIESDTKFNDIIETRESGILAADPSCDQISHLIMSIDDNIPLSEKCDDLDLTSRLPVSISESESLMCVEDIYKNNISLNLISPIKDDEKVQLKCEIVMDNNSLVSEKKDISKDFHDLMTDSKNINPTLNNEYLSIKGVECSKYENNDILSICGISEKINTEENILLRSPETMEIDSEKRISDLNISNTSEEKHTNECYDNQISREMKDNINMEKTDTIINLSNDISIPQCQPEKSDFVESIVPELKSVTQQMKEIFDELPESIDDMKCQESKNEEESNSLAIISCANDNSSEVVVLKTLIVESNKLENNDTISEYVISNANDLNSSSFDSLDDIKSETGNSSAVDIFSTDSGIPNVNDTEIVKLDQSDDSPKEKVLHIEVSSPEGGDKIILIHNESDSPDVCSLSVLFNNDYDESSNSVSQNNFDAIIGSPTNCPNMSNDVTIEEPDITNFDSKPFSPKIDNNASDNKNDILCELGCKETETAKADIGLELGGCWIDDIACVETVVSEDVTFQYEYEDIPVDTSSLLQHWESYCPEQKNKSIEPSWEDDTVDSEPSIMDANATDAPYSPENGDKSLKSPLSQDDTVDSEYLDDNAIHAPYSPENDNKSNKSPLSEDGTMDSEHMNADATHISYSPKNGDKSIKSPLSQDDTVDSEYPDYNAIHAPYSPENDNKSNKSPLSEDGTMNSEHMNADATHVLYSPENDYISISPSSSEHEFTTVDSQQIVMDTNTTDASYSPDNQNKCNKSLLLQDDNTTESEQVHTDSNSTYESYSSDAQNKCIESPSLQKNETMDSVQTITDSNSSPNFRDDNECSRPSSSTSKTQNDEQIFKDSNSNIITPDNDNIHSDNKDVTDIYINVQKHYESVTEKRTKTKCKKSDKYYSEKNASKRKKCENGFLSKITVTKSEKNKNEMINFHKSEFQMLKPFSTISTSSETEKCDFFNPGQKLNPDGKLLTKAARKYIPPLSVNNREMKLHVSIPKEKLLSIAKLNVRKHYKAEKPLDNSQSKNRMVLPKKKPKPRFDDVLKNIDDTSTKICLQKITTSKKSIPKMIIKKNKQGSHYASTLEKNYNPDLTGNKWQPWVCLQRDAAIERMIDNNILQALLFDPLESKPKTTVPLSIFANDKCIEKIKQKHFTLKRSNKTIKHSSQKVSSFFL